jgi:glycine/D-amino acid oxidase-like deaminating enzyme
VSTPASASFWHDDPALRRGRRAPLDGDTRADVVVVGAGYTGLWTAYYLLRRDPHLDVLVVEAEQAGFGASGRNGGWCSALLPQGIDAIAAKHGRPAAVAMRRAMIDTVDEVGRVAEAEDIQCHYRKGGTVIVARSRAQLDRARAEVAHDAARGGLEELQLLDAGRTRELVGVRDAVGSTFTPHCARLHPARLAEGLAGAIDRLGGRIVEDTRATSLSAGRVETERGTVRARSVVRATEAWTARLPGSRRAVAPVYSLVIATAPLPQSFWDDARLTRGETFSEHRHVIVYGQRTNDDRLVFGGRGAPYHFGSAIEPSFDDEPAVFAALEAALVDLFPAAAGVPVTHRWGGPLGIARDWHASVGYDPSSGLGWAGGYVGDGVSTTNLAGRTLADLVTGTASPLTALPWVGHRSRAWEPEPLRWLGINAGLKLATLADHAEHRLGRGTPLSGVLAHLTGH